MTSKIVTWFLYLCIFAMGLIIGRISMAIQYAVMKPKK